jgi:SNF2 family DNA or RNA helicase
VVSKIKVNSIATMNIKIDELCDLTQNLTVADTRNNLSSNLFIKNDYKLYSYQKQVMKWMKRRENDTFYYKQEEDAHRFKGGIINLSMGLGKTLTALAYSFQNKASFPTLIVTSKTVMYEWKTEGVDKFFITEGVNAVKVLYLHKDFIGKQQIDNINRDIIMKYDIVITTYDVCMFSCRRGKYYLQCIEFGDDRSLMKDRIIAIHNRKRSDSNIPNLTGTDVIYGTPWERIICDESQKYANPATMTFKCMMAIYGKYKWCLTATPIKNYDTDIWAQLRFCGYLGVKKAHEWKKRGNELFKSHNLISAIYILSYSDVNIELPIKTENTIIVPLTGKHQKVYKSILKQTRAKYAAMMNKLCSFSCVLAMFTKLRQCAIAPYLISRQSEELNKFGVAGTRSLKIKTIIDLFKQIEENKNHNYSPKIIVFSTFTSCLDLLSAAVKEQYPSFKFVQVDGTTKNRVNFFNQFKTDNTIQGLFLTYKIGSEGLNLTEATHCICVEPWWNNAVHNQAKARLWRTGQTKPVYVHNLIIEGSIEEKILDICNEKEDMASSFLNGTERKLKSKGLDKYILGKLLGVIK